MDAEKFRIANALSTQLHKCEEFLYNLHSHKGFDVDIDMSFCGIEGIGDSIHFNLRNIDEANEIINEAVITYWKKIKKDFDEL